jgi:Leucine-rich repeat (LRR) protein
MSDPGPGINRFSVRLLRPLWIGLAAVVLIAAAALQFGIPIYRQQAVIREIERLGGSWGWWDSEERFWIRRLFGDERTWLDPVTSVDLTESKATDSDLAKISSLPSLRVLRLGGVRISDHGAVFLKRMTRLEELDLGATGVTDVGMGNLRGLSKLETLSLGCVPISDTGLANLAGLTHLRHLYLNQTAVTDRALTHLTGLADLETLDLDGTPISDAGLSRVKSIESLGTLYLGKTRVTDAGLAQLAHLTHLMILGLDHTAVTDAGLGNLAELTTLKCVYLEGTAVTDVGLAKLKGVTSLEELWFRERVAGDFMEILAKRGGRPHHRRGCCRTEAGSPETEGLSLTIRDREATLISPSHTAEPHTPSPPP